jgi:hypothetical protein
MGGHHSFQRPLSVALCNAAHKVEGCISRWLLELHDRSGDSKIPLKQDTLAQMLAIRRTTVTMAAGNLEKDGVLICGRGYMQIVSRDALQRRSCQCYGRNKGYCMPLTSTGGCRALGIFGASENDDCLS